MFPIIYKCSIYFPLHCHFGHWSSETGYECRGNIKPFHLNQHKVQDYFLLSQRVLSQPSAAIAVSCPEGVVGVLFYGETCAIKYSRTAVYQRSFDRYLVGQDKKFSRFFKMKDRITSTNL